MTTFWLIICAISATAGMILIGMALNWFIYSPPKEPDPPRRTPEEIEALKKAWQEE